MKGMGKAFDSMERVSSGSLQKKEKGRSGYQLVAQHGAAYCPTRRIGGKKLRGGKL